MRQSLGVRTVSEDFPLFGLFEEEQKPFFPLDEEPVGRAGQDVVLVAHFLGEIAEKSPPLTPVFQIVMDDSSDHEFEAEKRIFFVSHEAFQKGEFFFESVGQCGDGQLFLASEMKIEVAAVDSGGPGNPISRGVSETH